MPDLDSASAVYVVNKTNTSGKLVLGITAVNYNNEPNENRPIKTNISNVLLRATRIA
jgi:hypothetical protein